MKLSYGLLNTMPLPWSVSFHVPLTRVYLNLPVKELQDRTTWSKTDRNSDNS